MTHVDISSLRPDTTNYTEDQLEYLAKKEDILQAALQNPVPYLRELNKLAAEDSLIEFMKQGWHALEPATKFVANWGVSAICDHLQAVSYGHIKRLLITVPPGCTKSMTVNVFWPAWEWGPMNMPHLRFISWAHEQGLATRDNVRCRDLINSEWYQENWGHEFMFKGDQNAKIYYENDKTGWRQSCAAESMTGKRGDRVIGDDPHSVKGADSDVQREDVLQTFAETVPTRLNKQNESAIIIIMQRVHERDVAGLILTEELGYEHLMLPMEFEPERRCYSVVKPSYMDVKPETVYFNHMTKSWVPYKPGNQIATQEAVKYNVDPRTEDGELLDPIRFPEESLDDLKKALRSWGGTYAEAGQLQQRPAPRGGGMFQKNDFTIIDSLNELGKMRKVVRGWDLASSKDKKSAFTVGLKMGITIDEDIVIMDVVRGQWTPGIVNTNLKKAAERDGYNIEQDLPQDPGQAGKSQISAFAKLLIGYRMRHSTESGSKEDRAKPLAAQAESGNVYILRADWNDTFINEAAVFPAGEFLDQIDAASRAFARLLLKKPDQIPVGPVVVGQGHG
jgi:predicted phage terminase large subunit-like protein